MPRNLIVTMDEVECKLIIHNAISNAMQYTPENGEIIFDLDMVNQMLEMNLYNDSISQDIDYTRVFELFYNLGNAETKRMSSGVGMYTIQHMVNLYKGNVTFSPEKTGVILFIQIPQLGSEDNV